MLSDLRECVTGDTLVVLADGRRVPISELVGTCPDCTLRMAARGNIDQDPAYDDWFVEASRSADSARVMPDGRKIVRGEPVVIANDTDN